jgi:hypothetical protein
MVDVRGREACREPVYRQVYQMIGLSLPAPGKHD